MHTTAGQQETATHIFLKLRMPFAESDYPSDRLLLAGETYNFPFQFSIPGCLLSQICTPRNGEDIAGNAHLLLPPSLGDSKVSSDGKVLRDDMAPDFTRITYYVRAIVHGPAAPNEDGAIVMDGARKIRLIPHYIDEPPFDVTNSKDDFIYTKVKQLKKGGMPFSKGRLGTLTVWVNQPKPLRLPAVGLHHDVHLTGEVKVHIRFDPANATSKPPILSSLTTNLKCHTFYSSCHLESFLNRRYPTPQGGKVGPWGKYVTTLGLPNRCMTETTPWQKHEPQSDATFCPLVVTLSRIPSRGSHVSSSDEASSDSEAEDATTRAGASASARRGTPPAHPSSAAHNLSSSSTPLPATNPSHSPSTSRHPSLTTTTPTPEKPYYTCNVPSPITFPTERTYLPTFASCHIARQYSISLGLNVRTHGALTQMLRVRLSVPLQVSVAARAGTEGRTLDLPEMSGAQEEGQLRELLGPGAPGLGGQGGVGEAGAALPPEYSEAGYAGVMGE